MQVRGQLSGVGGLSASTAASRDGALVAGLAWPSAFTLYAIFPPSISYHRKTYDSHSDTGKKWTQHHKKCSNILGMLSKSCSTNPGRLKFLSGTLLLNVKELDVLTSFKQSHHFGL